MDEFDTSTFEQLHGERPWSLLDRHPDGQHVAMQVIVTTRGGLNRAAIWDLQTGKIAWAPENAAALAWFPGGAQVALISERYERSPDHPTWAQSPLQREFTHTFARLTWPERTPLDECRLTFPTGWPVDLAISPRGDLAVAQWNDQGESGLEFVEFTKDGPHHMKTTGLPPVTTGMGRRIPNEVGFFPLLSFRLVFSPDGRYIVMAWQDEWAWWNADDATVEAPSPGGEYTIGAVSVLDWDTRAHHAIPITETLPVGWLPETRSDGGEGLLDSDPIFLDARHFSIKSPTGSVHTFSVDDA